MKDEWIDGWMDKLMYGWMNKCLMYGWIDGRIDR